MIDGVQADMRCCESVAEGRAKVEERLKFLPGQSGLWMTKQG